MYQASLHVKRSYVEAIVIGDGDDLEQYLRYNSVIWINVMYKSIQNRILPVSIVAGSGINKTFLVTLAWVSRENPADY